MQGTAGQPGKGEEGRSRSRDDGSVYLWLGIGVLWLVAFGVFAYYGSTGSQDTSEPDDANLQVGGREVLFWLGNLFFLAIGLAVLSGKLHQSFFRPLLKATGWKVGATAFAALSAMFVAGLGQEVDWSELANRRLASSDDRMFVVLTVDAAVLYLWLLLTVLAHDIQETREQKEERDRAVSAERERLAQANDANEKLRGEVGIALAEAATAQDRRDVLSEALGGLTLGVIHHARELGTRLESIRGSPEAVRLRVRDAAYRTQSINWFVQAMHVCFATRRGRMRNTDPEALWVVLYVQSGEQMTIAGSFNGTHSGCVPPITPATEEFYRVSGGGRSAIWIAGTADPEPRVFRQPSDLPREVWTPHSSNANAARSFAIVPLVADRGHLLDPLAVAVFESSIPGFFSPDDVSLLVVIQRHFSPRFVLEAAVLGLRSFPGGPTDL